MTSSNAVGQPTRLIDGRAKVTGQTRFAPDVHLPGMLHARFVTSDHAHARISNIDTAAALDVPGVVAVITASDLPQIAPRHRPQLLLARDRVIFAGQPLALVLADNAASAQDGAEQVLVDLEPLAAAITMAEALADDAPLVWPAGMPGDSEEAAAHGADVGGEEEDGRQGNVANRTQFNRGDVQAGLAEADVVVEAKFTTPMAHQSYLEPHATVVQPDPLTGGMTVWTSTQAPFHVREQVAQVLDIPESDVRVLATPVGGAFGGKFVLYEPLLALAARHVGRPVQLVLTRVEEMLAGNPAAAGRLRLRLGAKTDGTLTALEADLAFDGGCYPSAPLGIAAVLLGSLYRVPNLAIYGTEVLTFKPSSGAYRAPGAPQAAFALESLVDELATRLNRDPIDLRLQNVSEPGDPMVHGRPWAGMGARQVLEALGDHPAWQNREAARRHGRGVGVALGAWPGGTEPAAAACMLNRDGTLHLHLGAVDLTGSATTFALLAADAFGIALDKVRIVSGDTSRDPYAGAAGGSKTVYTVGPAVLQAAREARTQVLDIAAEEFEAASDDLEIVDGVVRVRGVPERSIPLHELASMTMQFGGRYAPVFGHGRHVDTRQAPGLCAQLAEVEVDRETGQVRVRRLVVLQDVGRALNPLAVEGQMAGGAVQGLGWALFEKMIYDEHGQLLTASWLDYTVPHSVQGPDEMETVIVEVPSEYGPLGARGVGEPPVIPTAAAVANAIADATGVRLTELPMTPPLVLAALSGSQAEL
jgi:CO/xanthine dehydrogenase Mo-binding subunit